MKMITKTLSQMSLGEQRWSMKTADPTLVTTE
jgi:hypothetical protein